MALISIGSGFFGLIISSKIATDICATLMLDGILKKRLVSMQAQYVMVVTNSYKLFWEQGARDHHEIFWELSSEIGRIARAAWIQWQ